MVLFANNLFSVERQSEAGQGMLGANCFVSLPLHREIGLFIFIKHNFKDSENEHYDHPVPSLHWSITSQLYLYFRMEIKSEIIETVSFPDY